MRIAALLCLLLALATPLRAQDVAPIAAAIQALDDASKELNAVDAAFNGRTDAAERTQLKDRADAVKQTAGDQATALTAQLSLIDARVAQLGQPTPGVVEAPDIRAQRKLLAQQRSSVDSAVKRGKLIAIEADQLSAEIASSQANAFSERMSVQVASPLTPAFWAAVFRVLPRDLRRISRFFGLEVEALGGGLSAGGGWAALGGLIVALALMGPVRVGLRNLGRRMIIERAPGSRVRRSGLALWLAAVGMVMPGFAASALIEGLRGGGMLAAVWEPLAEQLVRGAFVSGLIWALGGALLQRHQPSWRLVGLSDNAARALRPWTMAAAIAVMASVLIGGFADAAGLSGPAAEASDLLVALIHVVLVVALLVAVGWLRARALADQAQAGTAPVAQAGMGAFSLAAWGVGILAAVALIAGYFTLGLLLARMLVWLPVVAATLYLLLLATDDICTTLFTRASALGRALEHGFGVRPSLVDQFGVALSALIRLLLVMIAISLVFRPFGSNIGSLLGQAQRLAAGVTIGQITVSPGAILRAAAVLALGLFIVRVIQKWLTSKYLPATELDAGARNSIAMVARYTGLILAALWALASLGIGIERIALLLSALSVGIGFGLQAITQNFVSGLILLAERPVKIGDWVRVGDQEGDVKRISVRATEIQIADKSTLIVPNSDLITKAILNKTLSEPIGRVQLAFSVPLGTDIARLKEMVLAMFAESAAVLDDPAPSVFIDSIADGRVNLNCFAYVASPRAAYGAKSDMLYYLLTKMPEAGIELGTTPQMVQWVGGGAPPAAPPGSEGVVNS